MVKTIGEFEFIDEFEKMGRGNNFTYEGKKALFEYFEEYEEGTGQQIELDVIANENKTGGMNNGTLQRPFSKL